MCDPGQSAAPGAPAPAPASTRPALAALHGALAYLATADATALTTAEQADCLRILERAESVRTAAHATVLTAFNAGCGYEDDGHGSARSWLRWRTRVTGPAAAAAMAWTRRLAAHPAVADALAAAGISAAGISASWARQICDWTDLLPPAARPDAGTILLAAAAAGAELADLAGLADELRSRTAAPDEDGDGDESGRSVRLDLHYRGHGHLRGDLTPRCAAALRGIPDALGKKAGPEDTRTKPQRDHDALEEAGRRLIAADTLPDRAGQPTRIQLHMSLNDFLNPPPGTAPGHGSGGQPGGTPGDGSKREYLARVLGLRPFNLTGPAPAGWAGPHATPGDLCDATITPVVTGHADHELLDRLAAELLGHISPSGEQGRLGPAYARELILRNAIALLSGPAGLASRLRTTRLTGPAASVSLPLDVGTVTDTIPPHLRRAVILRDTHCAFPGCDQPPAACQVHHIVPRSQGGPTSLNNLLLTCTFHHLIVIHQWGWFSAQTAPRQPSAPTGPAPSAATDLPARPRSLGPAVIRPGTRTGQWLAGSFVLPAGRTGHVLRDNHMTGPSMSTSQADHVRNVDEREARTTAEEAREAGWHRPSFGKQLFLGDFQLDLIHPHPRPDEEAAARGEEFCTRLREFCKTSVSGAEIERDARIPDDVVTGLASLGAFGMKIAPEFGGLGLSNLYYNRALMIVGSASPAIGALLSAHQSIGVPQPLAQFGSDEQKQEYLPRCARGEISAFLLTEPDVGSDPARLNTTATPSDDGSEYVLNGVKLWTTNGVVADLLVVMARVPKSDGHRGGISAFVVEGSAPGITVERRNAFMGLRGLENGVTRLHDVVVPAANRIGQEGQGLKIALTTLNTGRLSLPASCAAAGKLALKIAREWSGERVQWGRPVGEHEAVAKKISFIAATTYALEAVVELSSLLADDKRNDIRIEAAIAKLYCSEMGSIIVDELVQIRGGRGYETAESLAARGERGVPAEQMLRDMRINRIFEGSSEIMRLFIAREAVDAHLSAAGDVIDSELPAARRARAAAQAGQFYAKWLPTLVTGQGQRPSAYSDFGPLAAHLRYVERASRKLARVTFYGMGRWQGRLERKQGFLGRIVDIGAELFAMSAVCVRAQMDAKVAAGTSRAAVAHELADVFCTQARLRAEERFSQLWHNTDSADVVLARQVLSGRYTWLEQGIIDPSLPGPWISAAEPGPSKAENVHRHIG